VDQPLRLQRVELDDGSVLIDVEGTLDANTAEAFADNLDALLDSCLTRVVLRLKHASVSSIGACALLAAATRAQQRRTELVLVAPSDATAEALQRWGLASLLAS
jgi:anti-anti-sigma factor